MKTNTAQRESTSWIDIGSIFNLESVLISIILFLSETSEKITWYGKIIKYTLILLGLLTTITLASLTNVHPEFLGWIKYLTKTMMVLPMIYFILFVHISCVIKILHSESSTSLPSEPKIHPVDLFFITILTLPVLIVTALSFAFWQVAILCWLIWIFDSIFENENS
jgi:hypothetical protein